MNEHKDDEMPKEVDFKGGVRGKYLDRYRQAKDHDRVGPQDDPSRVRDGAGNGAVAGRRPLTCESLSHQERPSLLRPSEGIPLPERQAEGEVVHRAADDVSLVPVVQSTSLVGRNDGGVPIERADDIAVRGLRGTPQAVLKAAGNALLAVAFQTANTAKRGMEEAETDAAKAAFARITGDLVLKMYEMGYGKQVKHTFDIKSQEDLPAWEKVPPEVRAALESYIQTGEAPQEDSSVND